MNTVRTEAPDQLQRQVETVINQEVIQQAFIE
jgi:hypothetical protein